MNKSSAAFLAITAVVVAGCSDQSAMRFTIDKITDTSGTKPYVEADLVGSASSPCTTLQDPISITVRLEQPGKVGPSLTASINNVVIDFFYYDPNDGQLKGPVGLLSSKQYNISSRVDSGGSAGGTAVFSVPLATYLVKSWSQGMDCSGVPGYSAGVVDRMVARVTVNAEDSTGKKLSCQGSIMVYLFNYPQFPVSTDLCYGIPTATLVSYLCP